MINIPTPVSDALCLVNLCMNHWDDILCSSHPLRREALKAKCRVMLNHDRILCGEVRSRGLISPREER